MTKNLGLSGNLWLKSLAMIGLCSVIGNVSAPVRYRSGGSRRDRTARTFTAQVRSGSTFAFDVKAGEKAAFALLDHLQVMTLAVSLGGTETLISHPASMTHSGVARESREEIRLSDPLIRISTGIENMEDLISDLAQSLEYV